MINDEFFGYPSVFWFILRHLIVLRFLVEVKNSFYFCGEIFIKHFQNPSFHSWKES